jgi:hypothetical protein
MQATNTRQETDTGNLQAAWAGHDSCHELRRSYGIIASLLGPGFDRAYSRLASMPPQRLQSDTLDYGNMSG